jgi:hypothetical protein
VGLEADAVAVASGKMPVVQGEDALAVVEAANGRPVPLATHRTDDYCVVLFLTKQDDGQWRADIAPVRDGDVQGYGGGTGGIVRRSEVKPGEPFVEAHGRRGRDEDGMELVQVDGVSADAAVRMRWGDQVVAEAVVAPHGYYVLAAVLPADAQVTVESAPARS